MPIVQNRAIKFPYQGYTNKLQPFRANSGYGREDQIRSFGVASKIVQVRALDYVLFLLLLLLLLLCGVFGENCKKHLFI